MYFSRYVSNNNNKNNNKTTINLKRITMNLQKYITVNDMKREQALQGLALVP